MSRVLHPFEYFEPTSIKEAATLLNNSHSRVIAGGVDLVLKLRLRAIEADCIISLQKIPELNHIAVDDAGALTVGAMTTMYDIEKSSLIADKWRAFHEGNSIVGSMQTKMMSTAVGNLCTATPVSDVTPALYVLGGKFVIAGAESERTVAAEDFFTGIGTTVLQQGELVKGITLEPPAPQTGSVVLKSAKTHDDISKVCVGVAITTNNNTCEDIRIALGAVAITTIRAPEAEAVLKGKTISDELIDAASQAAAANISPITDVRSTKEYRKHITKILVRDGIKTAIERANRTQRG